MTHRTLLLLAVLPACALTEEAFPERFAVSWCARAKACDEDAYFDRWLEGTAECRPTTSDDVFDRSYGNGNDVCKYQEELASACLSRVADASCAEIASSDWYEACVDVWDCVAVIDR